MKTLHKFIYLLFLLPAFLMVAGCSEDDFGTYPGEYPEGSTEISMQMDFDPFAASTPKMRGAAGNLMKDLDDLCIIAYDMEGNLMDGFPVEITKGAHGLVINDIERNDTDASNSISAEKYTKQAKFKLTVPYGQYYIYGVANLGRYDGNKKLTSTYHELTSGGFATMVKKREDMLNASNHWDEDNFLNNRQMFGYFTNDFNEKSPSTGKDTNNKTVSINRPDMKLHSWLRRCASKVTIDFDGSGLRDNIYIYIRRATIHDIPKTCAMGMPNSVKSEDGMISYKNDDYRPNSTNEGVIINYGESADYKDWPRIAKGQPYIMENDERKNFHSEDAEALYLYENMQGDQGDKDNKEQHPDKDGTVIGADEKKDEVPYGSYIEVEAYYDMVSSSHVSQGRIIYRFMLGKDILNNFDVERNHHYKLTMCVRGNGNDVDWHIEYTEDIGFETRDPYYVSYLYNHESTLRFRYTPPKGRTVTSIDAEIIGNNWWPEKGSFSLDQRWVQRTLWSNDPNISDPLNEDSYRTDNKYNGGSLNGRTRYLGNGFLSLRETKLTVLNLDQTTQKTSPWTAEDNVSMNDNYFYGKGFNIEQKDNVDRSKRTYRFNEHGSDKDDNTNTGREAYEVENMGNGSLRFMLPVFTRAKNLVKRTGYTGNNPYEASSRMAYVKVTVYLDNGDKDSEILRVEQVPRITNPKGIYRKSGNNENFHVLLTQKKEDNGEEFEAFKSDGPWMAEVIGDANFINLNGRSTIKGSTGDYIDFNVRFNKMNRDDKVRNAIIRVRYHNYSCVHLIFVRQGYKATGLYDDKCEWHTTNMITETEEGDDPRDEGSLFRHGALSMPIDVSCNVYSKVGIAPGEDYFTPPVKLNIATGKYTYTENGKSWKEITTNNNDFPESIAGMKDFEKLYLTEDVEQGFGVLYADGATETKLKTEDVYGYCRHDSEKVRNQRGMCGIFFYYWDRDDKTDIYNCRNFFMPIGRSGYGHRKNQDKQLSADGDGVLRYSCLQTGEFESAWTPNLIRWCPLFYDLYMRKGAIYWAQKKETATQVTGETADTAIGLDMNFFTFDVNLIEEVNLKRNGNWDACFLRAVNRKTGN